MVARAIFMGHDFFERCAVASANWRLLVVVFVRLIGGARRADDARMRSRPCILVRCVFDAGVKTRLLFLMR
eukprot:3172839-Pyramimonas_sp.AAC.1